MMSRTLGHNIDAWTPGVGAARPNGRTSAFLRPVHVLRSLCLLAVAILCTPCLGAALFTPRFADPLTEPYRWQLIPELSGKGYRCMVEDSSGTVWFGVNGGVLSYDGLQWKFHVVNQQWKNEPVVALCAAHDGTIYAGTPKGVGRFFNDAWKILPIHLDLADTSDYPNNRFPILETYDHSIWIGTHQGALRLKNDAMILYRSDGVYFNREKAPGFANSTLDSLPLFNVYSLYEEVPGRLWLGLTDGRIYRFDPDEKSTAGTPHWHSWDEKSGFRQAEFPCLIKHRGNLVVASQQSHRGLCLFDGRTWQEFDLGIQFGVDNIHTDLLVTEDGTLWIGGLEHLYALKDRRWAIYDAIDFPIPANRLFLYETRDRHLWIGGLGGEVWRVDLSSPRWTTFQGLNFQGETARGDKWFLSYDGRIVSCDRTMKQWRAFDVSDGLMDTPVTVLITRAGKVWAAGSHQLTAATALFDGHRWQRHLHPQVSWGIDYRAVLEDQDGSIWLGSSVDADIFSQRNFRGGLIHIIEDDQAASSGLAYEYHYFDHSFSLGGVYGIGQTADRRLWIGQLGLYSLDPITDRCNRLNEPRRLVENFIDCIHTTAAGDLWFGTRSNGLFRWDGKSKQWTNFTAENGLSSNTIISLFAKSDSDVWVATDQDVCHYDGQSWVAGVFPAHIKMTSTGGSLCLTQDGALWINQRSRSWNRRALYAASAAFKIQDGYQVIRYQPDRQPPETRLTFAQDKISQPGNVLLSWIGQDPWKSTPDHKLQYSYRMDQNAWSAFTEKSNELFLSVPHGKHRFEVRARDMDMNVDPTPAGVSFTVIPPTWKQLWFISLMGLFMAIILVFTLRLLHRNRIIRELSEAKIRLFANISHEFRTPLTLLIGPLQQMRSALGPQSTWRDQLDRMERNSIRLLRLVNQLLDFQKIEAGHLHLETIQDDVMGFIAKTAAMFENIAKEKQIAFRVETHPKIFMASFDPDKLEKILYNLLSNSFKFTAAHGKVDLSASAVSAGSSTNPSPMEKTRHSNAAYRLELTIHDNGIGISAKELPKIFDRFYQSQDAGHVHRGGTGIGLALVKELVALHQGHIEIESEPNQGTCFQVQLPLQPAATVFAEAHIPSGPESGKVEASTKPLILLIEDNPDMSEYIRNDLIATYRIVEARDGREGLSLATRHQPDLIISDVMMPVMDGITFCRECKSRTETSHIPIILLTARSSTVHKIEGLETGADDYITKPFHTRELQIRARNLIQSRQLLRERFAKQILVEPKEITITSTDEKFLRRAISLIESKLEDPEYDVESFSRDIGMSRVGLYYKLKALTDLSVQEFIFSMRLKRAAQLLKESGLTVTEVAYQVGFKDSSHFTKLFKKQFGIPPSVYMKQNK